MLVPVTRRSVSCNLRRIVACAAYRNKMRVKVVRCCDEINLLSISSPNIATCRIYSTESDSESQAVLPMLVTGAKPFIPSLFTPFRLFYLSFTIIPYIDKEFLLTDTLAGAKYAVTVISKALANRDYDSLEGLVADNMIEILRIKVEALSSEQRCLIAVNEEDIFFHILCDITAKATDKEHFIEFKTICHYIPGLIEKKRMLKSSTYLTDFSKVGNTDLQCVGNYIFKRNYINNVGGPWIATFANHFSIKGYRY